ncbi:arf-GAP with dual PH domain-containing protein 1 isoform X5 [Phyllopteryx taeniolatus]|uniref:arf-GAP with dual PH domain-containing protein 1 isoform X5 n=1 Tax=Phyllopteryx taeniolatus TaxID=161469 RepID=UPI002AD4DB8D|nr:arf-GAP with dual PH domain-containing protein 1 isoform X5 [Phyllopteryx taeniolatus]
MANWERNKRILLELVKLPENSLCADCGAPGETYPDWASCKLGLFVCLHCSGIHRNLSSRVKSIKLDYWEDEHVELMKCSGNAKARALYEKALPPYYYRPQQTDCVVLKMQWIRAKYERLEFTGETKYPPPSYTTGFYEGMLWKKGKENTQFLKRKFVLSEREFTLSYYNKENESKGPKAIISIKHLNVTFQPEKIGHPHGMQITYLDNDHTRSLYVYHESPEEIVTWYNALRAARYAYLKTAYPTGTEADDAEELGVIFLGTESNSYAVKDCVPNHTRGNKWKFGLMVETPKRQFVFMCEHESEQREWLDSLRQVISRPMTPQDYNTEANIRNKR